jgi:hypothetical protein
MPEQTMPGSFADPVLPDDPPSPRATGSASGEPASASQRLRDRAQAVRGMPTAIRQRVEGKAADAAFDTSVTAAKLFALGALRAASGQLPAALRGAKAEATIKNRLTDAAADATFRTGTHFAKVAVKAVDRQFLSPPGGRLQSSHRMPGGFPGAEQPEAAEKPAPGADDPSSGPKRAGPSSDPDPAEREMPGGWKE